MDPPKYRTSCDACLNAKVKCSQTKPSCSRCNHHANECVYSQYRKIGRPSKKSTAANVLTPSQQSKRQGSSQEPPPTLASRGARTTIHKKNGSDRREPSDASRPSKGGLEVTYSLNTTASATFRMDESLIRSDNGLFNPQVSQVFSHPYASPNFADGDMSGMGASNSSTVYDAMAMLPPLETGQLDNLQDQSCDPYLIWQPNNYLFAPSSEASSTCSGDSPPSHPFATYHSRHHSFADMSLPLPIADNTLPSPTSLQSALQNGDSASLSSVGSYSDMSNWSHARDQHTNSAMRLKMETDDSPTRDPWCTSDCYSTLTEQLRQLSGYLSQEHCPPLDLLLNLDEQVTREREKILRCEPCLSNPRSRHAFMLVVMVLEAMVGLFEKYCETHRSTHSVVPAEGHTLTLGDVEVDESTEGAFTRALLRMHFERQSSMVLRLTQVLSFGAKDSSYKAGRGILVDVCRRLERLQGLVSLATE